MADVVLQALAKRAGLADRIASSSAGTGDWHVGEQADRRTIAALAARGYDGAAHRARQFTTETFQKADLIVALDRSHQRILESWARDDEERERIVLLLSFDRTATPQLDVPDPYYADQRMFDEVLVTIESALHGMLRQLEPALRIPN